MTPRRRLVLEIAAIVAGGGVIGAGAIVLAMGGGCEPLFTCEDEEVARVPSPDGTREARVLVRNCGATTDFATHVVISERRWLLPDARHTVFVSRRSQVRVTWSCDRCLKVVHQRDPLWSRAESRAAGVTIEYEEF